MAFRKYQKVERSSVLSKDQHKQVESSLRKQGKHSVADLDEEERNKLTQGLDKS